MQSQHFVSVQTSSAWVFILFWSGKDLNWMSFSVSNSRVPRQLLSALNLWLQWSPPLLSTSPLSLHPIFSILIPRARLLWNGEPQNLACGRLLSTRARWSKVVPQCKQNLTVGDCEFRALVFELQGVQAEGALQRCVVWTLNRNLLFFHEMY